MEIKTNWMDLTRLELTAKLAAWSEPAFRGKQVYGWMHKGENWEGMGNLPKALKARMAEEMPLGLPEIIECRRSRKDDTEKYLYRYQDGQMVEGVLMQYRHGATLCVSTQVGCRMGCTFCASALGGLVRQLSAGEMLGQAAAAERRQRSEGRAPEQGRAVHNIVLMGSGEPLDNYDNLLGFLRLLNDEDGLNMSLRNVTVSTCGLPDKMLALAVDAPNCNLSVSLHAPEDEMRRSMMPIANRYTVAELVEAAREHVRLTGRRVTFEYALLAGQNDNFDQVDALLKLLKGFQCHVNVIPLNSVQESGLVGSSRKQAYAFVAKLEEGGVSATVRREMGEDIEGACGQLRAGYLRGQEGEA